MVLLSLIFLLVQNIHLSKLALGQLKFAAAELLQNLSDWPRPVLVVCWCELCGSLDTPKVTKPQHAKANVAKLENPSTDSLPTAHHQACFPFCHVPPHTFSLFNYDTRFKVVETKILCASLLSDYIGFLNCFTVHNFSQDFFVPLSFDQQRQ